MYKNAIFEKIGHKSKNLRLIFSYFINPVLKNRGLYTACVALIKSLEAAIQVCAAV